MFVMTGNARLSLGERRGPLNIHISRQVYSPKVSLMFPHVHNTDEFYSIVSRTPIRLLIGLHRARNRLTLVLPSRPVQLPGE